MKWDAERLRRRAADMNRLAEQRIAAAGDPMLPSGFRYAAAVHAESARELAAEFELLAANRQADEATGRQTDG